MPNLIPIKQDTNQLVPNNIYALKLTHHSVGMDTLFERINNEFWEQKKALTANNMIKSKLGYDIFMENFSIPDFLKLPRYEVVNLCENNEPIKIDEYDKLITGFSNREFPPDYYSPYLNGKILLFRFDEFKKASQTAQKLTIKRLGHYQDRLKQKLSLMDKAEYKLDRVIEDYDARLKQKEEVIHETLLERYANIDMAISSIKDIEVI